PAPLFPAPEAVSETPGVVVATWVAKLGSHRISLTPPVLNRAAAILFLVTGGDKGETLAAGLPGRGQAGDSAAGLWGPSAPDVYASQVVHPRSGALVWLVDRAASTRLTAAR